MTSENVATADTAAAVAEQGAHLDPERLAIELDRRIVKRAQWNNTVLPAGAILEIVQFVGGG